MATPVIATTFLVSVALMVMGLWNTDGWPATWDGRAACRWAALC